MTSVEKTLHAEGYSAGQVAGGTGAFKTPNPWVNGWTGRRVFDEAGIPRPKTATTRSRYLGTWAHGYAEGFKQQAALLSHAGDGKVYDEAEAALDYTPRSLDEILDALTGKR